MLWTHVLLFCQGKAPCLSSPLWEGMSVLTVVSAYRPLLPIPRPGNGHSKGAKSRVWGPGRCSPILLELHLPSAGKATG